MTPAVIDPARLSALDAVTLKRGGHKAPPPNAPASDLELCGTEFVAWLAGERHSDHPQCLCPALGGFIRRFNDLASDEGRQALKPFLPRAVGTRGDGHTQQRAFMAADCTVRRAAARFEQAGKHEAALIYAIPTIVDAKTAYAARTIVREARVAAGLPGWWQARFELKAKVYEAVYARLKDTHPAADADAAASASADAAADAAASASAVSAADAAASAAAVAAADAGDVAAASAFAADAAASAADAAAAASAVGDVAAASAADAADAASAASAAAADVAGDVADAMARPAAIRDAVYKAVHAVYAARWWDAGSGSAALELLEQMVALGEAERLGAR